MITEKDLEAICIVEGDKYRDAALSWISERSKVMKIWSEFAAEYNADRMMIGAGLCFYGKHPEGWTKPQSRNGFSRPKKGHPDIDRIKSMPRIPKTWGLFGDDIIFSLSYELPNGNRGAGMISFFSDGVRIGATGGEGGGIIIAVIPHAGRAAERLLTENPLAKISPERAIGWEVPTGLREISKAESDLIFAQAKVDMERKKAAA